ncbi:stage II sporulation protein P [Tepidibacter formicigenes]|jgi:stage II sporulation protein P|uniref:Stage II sporulation protein P n=1 Tax=Tepidibacter formicigenes DSM 15518 TaxID=1123349 RepID=A0A1M6LXI2_9FIRM|nr:stage II sporulation protein P [Tepidibacter formicigenes]SHJ75871.1 stage II sporulation protein P [Tepidibacter formicigenes DSM 15518]
MKRKEILISIILAISFITIFSFTSLALNSDEEDFLKYLIRKTYPELELEGKNKGLVKIGFNLLKKDKNEIATSNNKDYIKIEVVDDKMQNINVVPYQNNEKIKENNDKNIKIEVPDKIELAKGKPQILIYHTHGTESYEPEKIGNYHSLNKKYSVMSIGEKLKGELEKRGYSVLHNMDYHDYPSFNGSYKRSLETASNILKKYNSIKVVLDIHRDGVDIKNEEMRKKVRSQETVTINGEKVARFSIVVGPESPNRKEVEKFARYITSISNKKYPGLAKKVIVKPYGRFNQFLSNNYALLEIGGNANTIDEALKTTKYLADVLDEALNGMNR